jgi:AraC-like DNA-binding protein
MRAEVEKLTEYRTVQYSAESEASTYVTNQQVRVQLQFPNPIVCRMMSGHKVMRVDEAPAFDFVPGESMFVPPDMLLDIFFPEANEDNPTECMCIEIELEKVDAILARINKARAKSGLRHELLMDWNNFALFRRDPQIDHQLDRLMALYTEKDTEFRDPLIDANLSELVILLLQSQSRRLLIEKKHTVPGTGLDAAALRITETPNTRYSPEDLARIACMSPSTFFRHFKAKFGVTPSRFASQARIRHARDLLARGDASISCVSYDLGYSSVGHFVRAFRQITGETPGEYRRRIKELVRVDLY